MVILPLFGAVCDTYNYSLYTSSVAKTHTMSIQAQSAVSFIWYLVAMYLQCIPKTQWNRWDSKLSTIDGHQLGRQDKHRTAK